MGAESRRLHSGIPSIQDGRQRKEGEGQCSGAGEGALPSWGARGESFTSAGEGARSPGRREREPEGTIGIT
ncbi:unnamed protein product [Caretta caretta]